MYAANVGYRTSADHTVRWWRVVTWFLLLVVNGACVQRYAVDYTLSTRSIGPENQINALQFPPMSALDVLSEAKIVAFAPPDECLEASQGKDIARQRCGEVMTALEQAASTSGFQVVSWQAIRGNEPPLNYARRSNVDILFEISRLGPDDSLNDYTHTGSLSFFYLSGGLRDPLPVAAEVMAKCRNSLLVDAAQRAIENSVVLDMNMISVRTGVVVWNYRRLYRSFLHAADVKGTNYYEGLGPSDSIVCNNNDKIDEDILKARNKSYDHLNFQLAIKGHESSSELLHRASQLAAYEFIELLVLVQATIPHEKRTTPLKVPDRPKELQGRPDSNCETLSNWIRAPGGYGKTPPSWFSNCPKS